MTKAKLLKTDEYLTEELFIDAIMMCGLKWKELKNEVNVVAKVLNFIEQLFNSNGITIIRKLAGKAKAFNDNIDPRSVLKTKYPDIFNEPTIEERELQILNKVFFNIY